jgi:hypothetical protein
MGYDQVAFTVTARLSSHNDERDERDRKLWEAFQARVRETAEAPEFADIDIFVA